MLTPIPSRLKDNFTVIREEDNIKLIQAKQQVDAGFESSKWRLVGEAMKAKGTELYRPDVLQRQWKKLMAQADKIVEGKDPKEVDDEDFDLE